MIVSTSLTYYYPFFSRRGSNIKEKDEAGKGGGAKRGFNRRKKVVKERFKIECDSCVVCVMYLANNTQKRGSHTDSNLTQKQHSIIFPFIYTSPSLIKLSQHTQHPNPNQKQNTFKTNSNV